MKDFVIKELLEIKEIKDNIKILDNEKSSKYLNFIKNKFPIEYGTIKWEKFTENKEFFIENISDEEISNILKKILYNAINKTDLILIWSDINDVIQIKSDLLIKYHNKMFYPVKSDLWVLSTDYKIFIEFHHESYLNYTYIK